MDRYIEVLNSHKRKHCVIKCPTFFTIKLGKVIHIIHIFKSNADGEQGFPCHIIISHNSNIFPDVMKLFRDF